MLNVVNPQPNTVLDIFDRSQRMQILKANPDSTTINILDNLEDWEKLFVNCPVERTTWFKHDMEMRRIGRATGLPKWEYNRDTRGSTPVYQIAVLMTDSPGARVEQGRNAWELQKGQAVIYDLNTRWRLVGSKTEHAVFLVGTLYQHAED